MISTDSRLGWPATKGFLLKTLASLVLAVVLAQAAAPAPDLASPPAQPTTMRAAPTSVDEVVVTAPRQRKPEPPAYDVLTGSGARDFESEAIRKTRMRRYRETGSLKDYPGLRCAVFHRC